MRRHLQQRLPAPPERAQPGAVARGERGEGVEQGRRVVTVARVAGPDPAGDPHGAVGVRDGRAERGVGDGHAGRHLEARTERLEDRAAGERDVVEAEHGPVRELGGRRPAPPEGQVPARGAPAGESVELRCHGGLGGRPVAELGHGPVPEAVEDDEHDGQAVVDEARLGLAVSGGPHRAAIGRSASSARRTGTVAGGTASAQASAGPASRARMSVASILPVGSPSRTVTA